jgi:hypothetical protein
MSTFVSRPATPPATPVDPSKHVDYTLGMVLGVDDFTQEFAYHNARDQWLARDLIGYGTVSGLALTVTNDANGPRIEVSPGVAVSPVGQLIRVCSAQCASLNDWIRLNKEKLPATITQPVTPGGDLNVAVVLSYRDFPTDNVPIPGEPCRSEDDALVPSRRKDDYLLELRLTAPDQREEDALRDFVVWLRKVNVNDSAAIIIDWDVLRTAIRKAAGTDDLSTAVPPTDFMLGDPPATLQIATSQTSEFLRQAFRLWATELRARWRPAGLGRGCSCGEPSVPAPAAPEESVLLGELTLALGPDLRLTDKSKVTLREERRAYVLHLRMIQEWLLSSGRVTVPVESQPSVVALDGDVIGPTNSTELRKIQGVPVQPLAAGAVAKDGDVLTFRIAADAQPFWQAAPLPAQAAPVVPEIFLAGDVVGPANLTELKKIQGVLVKSALDAPGPSIDQVLTVQRDSDGVSLIWQARELPQPAAPIGLPIELAGDVSGPAASTSVDKLKTVPLAAPPPEGWAPGQVLTFDAVVGWRGADIPALGGDVVGSLGAVRIESLQGVPVEMPVAPAVPDPGHLLTFLDGKWRGAKLPPPPVGQDLSGDTAAATVVGIQGRVVEMPNPGVAGVLTLNGDRWSVVPAADPTPIVDVVRHPKGLPEYSIVAAGIVTGNKTSRLPTYNNLIAEGRGNSELFVKFDDYANPDVAGNSPYIVKVVPVELRGSLLLVNFLRFEDRGFVLRAVHVNGEPVQSLENREFMIEVSRYDRPPGR